MSSSAPKRVALVAGATGVNGRHLLAQFVSSGLWSGIYGLSRKADQETYLKDKVKYIALDLTGAESTLTKELSGIAKEVTHVFFTAFQDTGNPTKDVEVNFGMMKRLIECTESAGAKLHHVHFLSGTKWYGNSLGPIKTPSREDDPRAMPPNFYYDMEDYCVNRVHAGATWRWSSVRPNPVAGRSAGSVMNITMTIAAYASICKELRLPLRFPGSAAAYNALLEVVDAGLLAESIEWIVTHDQAGNTAYNVSNGDIFRWSQVWPKIADFFGLPLAEPQHFSLTAMMPLHEGVWKRLIMEHSLQDVPLEKAATWPFGDWVFKQETDWFSDVSKLRRAGFQGMVVDSADMFFRQFRELREARLIP